MLSLTTHVTRLRLCARVLEGVAHDALAARARDELKALVDLVRLAVLDARVEVLLVLAHNHDVDLRVLGLDEGVERDARAHVRKEAERLADRHVEACEGRGAARRGWWLCGVSERGATEGDAIPTQGLSWARPASERAREAPAPASLL